MSKEVKEPAVRMIKRDTISTAKAWGIRLIAVVLSLIVGNDPRDIGAFMYCDRTDTGI